MKFLHTADLHLGNKMHEVEREEEYKELLDWLRDTIVEQNVETLVVAGDIYDTKTPPISARKMFNHFLASLLGSNCSNIILVGGNHDSGALLDSNRELMEELNIHIVGSIVNKDVSDTIFKLYDNKGNVTGICAAIPYVDEDELKRFDDAEPKQEDKEFLHRASSGLYKEVLEEARKVRGDLQVPIITTGHLYAANLSGRYADDVMGDDIDDGVRNLDVVGNLGRIQVSAFPEEFDYVALGHIHYHTKVADNNKIRYSGSPVVMGFDETDVLRNVLLVECEYGKETTVKALEIPSRHQYLSFTGDRQKLKKDLEELIKTCSSDKNYYVELRYNLEDSTLVNEMTDSMDFPSNIQIVSSKVIRNQGSKDVYLGDRSLVEMNSLVPDEVFRSLILSNLPEGLENISDEEKEAFVNKYIGYFRKAYDAATIGEDDEDN